MSASPGKKTMTISKELTGYGEQKLYQVVKCYSYMKCREVSVSLYEQTALCIKYPHQIVRGMGQKESDSHHTGLAPEEL